MLFLQNFKSKIINTPVGNISEPILLPEGILFFKIRDKRVSKKFINLEHAKNELVNMEKKKYLKCTRYLIMIILEDL